MRTIIPAILLLGAFLCISEVSSAQCDCAGGTPETEYRWGFYRTAYEELEKADVVFVGIVVENNRVELPDGKDYEYVTTYRVTRAWKKDVDEL
jgi:hypothetical protein